MSTAGTIIRCPECGTANRVRPIPRGTPQCAKCHAKLPWVVTADEGTFAAETTSSVPVLVDFWAPWCGPCRMVSPVLERLAARFAGGFKVVKVNVDENPGLGARFDARSIPLLVMMQDGAEVARQIGAVPEAQLLAWIRPHVADPAR
ncbi:MAG: thioredoxin [Actinobacteria bacterium]|nr:thioredoxin [Actinomycetota bacterium]